MSLPTRPAGGIRDSDRWLTPRTVAVGLVVAGVLVLATIGAVTYLTAIGRDPNPMLKLVGQLVTAVGSLGAFVVTLASRQTVAKVERNQAAVVQAVEEAARPRHAAPDTAPGLPAARP